MPRQAYLLVSHRPVGCVLPPVLVAVCIAWAAVLLPAVGAQASLAFYTNAAYYDRFNPPPQTFNTQSAHVGYDSQKRDDWNALQFRGGAKVAQTPIYDNQGNPLIKKGKPAVTEAGPVGHINGKHLGKIHAGAVAEIEIDGEVHRCVYLAAVDITRGGTHSGWVRADQMSPAEKVWKISSGIYKKRESARVRYTANPKGDQGYQRYTVIDQAAPEALKDGYIKPQRSSNSGKTKYYYIREGLLNGFINLPETGKGRHGVQASRSPVGSTFHRDADVRPYAQKIYGPDSKKVVGGFDFIYGYFETNAGTKIYCWTNSDCLEAE